jgi:hypothetical protein
MTVYAHVLPGDQKRAATRFAELVGEAREYQSGITARVPGEEAG